jgi:hypothetical protein
MLVHALISSSASLSSAVVCHDTFGFATAIVQYGVVLLLVVLAMPGWWCRRGRVLRCDKPSFWCCPKTKLKTAEGQTRDQTMASP